MLSPRRVLAIGLATFVGGILVYAVGVGMSISAAQTPLPGDETGMTRLQAAAEIHHNAAFAGGSLLLLGVALLTAAAVWWLWAGKP